MADVLAQQQEKLSKILKFKTNLTPKRVLELI